MGNSLNDAVLIGTVTLDQTTAMIRCKTICPLQESLEELVPNAEQSASREQAWLGLAREKNLPDIAIQASDIGITPQNDGKSIRLVFPSLTEERRRELTKQTMKMGEDAKVALRNIRREANDKAKDMKKASEMTEDEQKASEKDTQELTDRYIKEVDVVVEKKNKEIMEL